ncbi:Slm1p [Sugiyamaella lignohabitans]|uniref:Slm1p n=1 Tax=Sugiyamaella lignohabitans TaxID=796027 RepID=A0A161HG73_9ASCO|nr:Slm1p [Sugiyamaella lignohabitans]ANB11711.1 Slm1p [Sugiyamaella lignohabitans]
MDDLYLKSIPTNSQPTDILAARFSTWRKVIRALNVYFREVATVQDEYVRQNVRLGHAVNFPFFENGTSDGGNHSGSAGDFPDHEDRMFAPFGSNSIADVPGNLIQYHRTQAAAASRTSKELIQNLIPRLEDLRRDLLVKIKEIKNLGSDFRNNVAKEQQGTARDLNAYVNAIEVISTNPASLSAKHDPYLLRPALEKQINRQVNEENYLLEAFLNLQGSGQELEKVVTQEVQQALSVFAKLLGIQGQNTTDLFNKIIEGYVAKSPTAEWDAFIARDDNFVDPNLKPRKVEDISYKYQDSYLAHEVRTGYLERRSKYLKSYSRAWYVLTPSFLHEFKSNDRKHDPHPVMSLSLDDCQLTHDPKSSSSHSHKFILNAKQSGTSSGRGHNWVFRAESKEKMEEWFKDLSTLTNLSSPNERVAKIFKSVPGTSAATAGAATAAAGVSAGVAAGAGAGAGAGESGTGAAESGAVDGIAGESEAAVVGPSADLDGNVSSAGDGGHFGGDHTVDYTQVARDGHVAGAAAFAGATGAAAGVGGFTAIAAHDVERHSAHSRSIRSHTPHIDENGDTYIPVVAPISSPVPSDTSGVTSNGEPFQDESDRYGATEHNLDEGTQTIDNSVYSEHVGDEERTRGRFPSEVNLEHTVDPEQAVDEETLHREAAAFIVPSDLPNNNTSDTAVDDQASVFTYDLTHTAATLPDDKDFKPVGSEIPVHIERRLTATRHKEEEIEGTGIGIARHPDEAQESEEALISRRRSSVASHKRPQRAPSRKATGSYGTDELKPLSPVEASEPAPLFFANGLPSTTGGADN